MDVETLHAWMKEHRMNATDVADAIGMHPVTVRKWLAGMQEIRHPKMLALALDAVAADHVSRTRRRVKNARPRRARNRTKKK